MYPNLYYAFRDFFGVEWPALRFINSFGFFVAFAFLAAAYVLTQELRRRERLGLMQFTEMKIVVGRPATMSELALNFILGFLLGYKILGLFLSDRSLTEDPQSFIFSAQGYLPAGLLLGCVFGFVKWWEKNKQKLAKPEERAIRIWPHDRVGDIVILAAIFGFLGAKIFHNLENWNEFWKNPVEALLSFSGLTFYGGLICATIAIIWYAKKHRIGIRQLADSIAPALMLAYAIGRIGCQVSGDGDWGILNSAYISTPEGKVALTDTADFNKTLSANSAIYMEQSGYTSIDQVHHKYVKGPSWLPQWMTAFNYPHNVINEGVPLKNCEGQYCRQLPLPVFPTAFYETVICMLLTALLFFLRSRFSVPGTIFAVYLILNGLERFFIEKIRVNTQYNLFGFHPTQAELISTFLILTGIILIFICDRKKKTDRYTSINV
ncbi:MAG TPA: prolipoprotein diacylglyceryl transferase family protein [Flavitalea sp.]|nr:prolipoprotein diacylglyceryl transferase family protein [Flavitalea sp.]